MTLDPQTQGDVRTKKHADVCNGYLPTELASEEERKMGCAECCDCWCHFSFNNPDGSDREDAAALRAEIRRLNLEIAVTLEMRKKGQKFTLCPFDSRTAPGNPQQAIFHEPIF